MSLENNTTRAILDANHAMWEKLLETRVAIVGAGPSGMVCAKYLADKGITVSVFERHLSFGGGTWGGGVGYPQVTFESTCSDILEDMGIRTTESSYGDLLVASSVEVPAKLGSAAIDAGARIVTATVVEDLVIEAGTVNGVVLNATSIVRAGLHIDPLALRTECVVDATGHESAIAHVLAEKNSDVRLEVQGERSMWAEKGEEQLLTNTKEIYPGLWVTGMAANGVYGGYRMGAVFGGMFLSGKKCADEIARKLGA